jgi:sugar phosphate permease
MGVLCLSGHSNFILVYFLIFAIGSLQYGTNCVIIVLALDFGKKIAFYNESKAVGSVLACVFGVGALGKAIGQPIKSDPHQIFYDHEIYYAAVASFLAMLLMVVFMCLSKNNRTQKRNYL